mgnify:FL=1
MAITTEWSINNMVHVDADGGVILVYWSVVGRSDGDPVYTASDGGKLKLEYDASSPDFTPYADLTENQVLGWVWDSLADEGETATQAKERYEAARVAKVQAQIDRAAEESSGFPWET